MDNGVETLREIAREYPQELVPAQFADIPRVAFILSLIAPRTGAICDLGGGTGMLSAACKAAGARRVVVVDDFNDPINHQFGEAPFSAHKKLGVEFVSRDVLVDGLSDFQSAFDVVACIDSIEHWHHSPKAVLHQAVRALVPGGRLIIGVPNALNLRKRVSWMLGTGAWTSMESWYEQPVFRSHIREPSVADLHYIARDLGLGDCQIYGRNWSGFISAHRYRRLAAHVLDGFLRLRPSLCSDLYLVGHRRA